MNLYYCILKNYKGSLKKKYLGNTHLLLIPIDEDNYLYLGMVGEINHEQEENEKRKLYAAQLIVKLPTEIIDEIIDEEENYFPDRFILMETLDCIPKKISSGEYNIKIPKKGNMILSDLHIELDNDYSSNNRIIYLLKGKFSFETADIKSTVNMKMIAAKQMAYMGNKVRFESYIFDRFI